MAMSINKTVAVVAITLAAVNFGCQSHSTDSGSQHESHPNGRMGQPGEAVEQIVQLKPTSTAPLQAGNIEYQFQLIDSASNNSVTDKDLMIESEKLLHLIIFDPALIEFRHLHPEFRGNYWSVKTDLPVNGNYWVWAEGKLTTNQAEFYSSSRLDIQGGLQANSMSQLRDTRTGDDSGSIASLSNEVIRSKQMSMLTLTMSRQDGSQPQISDYLGNKAHIIAVSSDGSSMIHLHPMEGSRANELTIHSEFPRAETYRIWVQFIDGGSLKVVPLAVSVID